MTPIYFRVNNKIIFNDILAKYESYTSGQPIEFICHTEAYDKLDWTQEPSQSFEELMDWHARSIRNKYEKIVLSWSGGTDSHTIYNVFCRNNLHIDEIVIWVNDEYEPWASTRYVEWMQTNHADPLTKITIKHRFDPEAKQKIVTGEDWIFQNISMVPKFAMGTTDSVMWDYCNEQYGASTWCLVHGHEQPRVFLKNGKYYSCHDAKPFLSVMNFDHIECFFTEPLLTLKQSHMIKKMLKRLATVNKFTEDISDKYYNTTELRAKLGSAQGYAAWTKGAGRHPEVFSGISHYHKHAEFKFEFQPVIPTAIDGELSRGYDQGLNDLLKIDHPVAQAFERGIKNLLLEKNFCDHLLETSLETSGVAKSVLGKSAGKPTYSKLYCIGE